MKSLPAALLFAFLYIAIGPTLVSAQDGESFKAEFLQHFNASARKFLALAEAMPADKYAWSPGEGTMTVERVYMHIARYNYNYPHTYLGTKLTKGVDLDTLEEVTGKEAVLKHLENSIAYVRQVTEALGPKGFAEPTRLYGRDVEGWGVFFQLITHMNEHLGQSIAYARINGVVPPWSQ